MATVDWRHLFLYAQVHHEALIGSNHCPLLLHCSLPPKRIPRLFKFESMLTSHFECAKVISFCWAKNNHGSPIFRLYTKLTSYSRRLVTWGKAKFGDNQIRINSLKSEIQQLQACPYSNARMATIRELQRDLETVLNQEEMYQHQRSRVNWLNYGDKNSSFFHATVV